MIIPRNLRAVLSMVVSMGVFVASDSFMKLALLEGAPLFQLMLVRGIAAVTICVGLITAMGQAHSLPRMFNPWLIARGLCEAVANLSFTVALSMIAIADLTAIAQTCPLFVLLGAWLFRGERLSAMRLVLILVGILGAMLVAQPGAGAASPYAVLGFLTAIAAALRDLITPRVPKDMPPLVAALSVIFVLMLVGGIGTVSLETPAMPGSWHILLMVMAGTLMMGGHFFVFIAYKIGPARTVAPFMYSLTIWAVLSGLLLFGEVPNALAIAGMALVAAAGLSIIYVEGRERRSEPLVLEPLP